MKGIITMWPSENPANAATTEPALLPTAAYDALVMKWQAAKDALDTAKETEMELRKQVAAQNLLRIKEDGGEVKSGVNNLELGNGYVMKTTVKYNYKLDKDHLKVSAMQDKLEATGNEGSFISERLIKWSADIDVTEYKALDPKYKKIVDTVLTIEEGTPTVEIKEPKAKKA